MSAKWLGIYDITYNKFHPPISFAGFHNPILVYCRQVFQSDVEHLSIVCIVPLVFFANVRAV